VAGDEEVVFDELVGLSAHLFPLVFVHRLGVEHTTPGSRLEFGNF